MKKFLGFFLVLQLAFTSGLQAQNKSADDYLQRIFILIKNNDVEGYRELFPGYEKMKEMLNHWFNQIPNSTQRNQGLHGTDFFTAEVYQKGMGEEVKKFTDFLHTGRSKGINWAEIQFTGASYKILEASTVEFRPGVLEGSLTFTLDTAHYTAYFWDILLYKPDQKWFGGSLSFEDQNDIVTDSISRTDSAFMTDSIVVREVSIDKVVERDPPKPPPLPPSEQRKQAIKAKTSQSKKTTTSASNKTPLIKPKKVKP